MTDAKFLSLAMFAAANGVALEECLRSETDLRAIVETILAASKPKGPRRGVSALAARVLKFWKLSLGVFRLAI